MFMYKRLSKKLSHLSESIKYWVQSTFEFLFPHDLAHILFITIYLATFHNLFLFNCESEILIETVYENMTSKLSSDKAVIRGYILYAAWAN